MSRTSTPAGKTLGLYVHFGSALIGSIKEVGFDHTSQIPDEFLAELCDGFAKTLTTAGRLHYYLNGNELETRYPSATPNDFFRSCQFNLPEVNFDKIGFPAIFPEGRVTYKLFRFDWEMPPADTERIIDAHGFQTADGWQLACYASEFRQFAEGLGTRRVSIVSIGYKHLKLRCCKEDHTLHDEGVLNRSILQPAHYYYLGIKA